MNSLKQLVVLCLVVFPVITFAQSVVVTGALGDNTNSSPRDENGAITGPETDNSFQTLPAAVQFLMDYRNGGTVVINAPGGAVGWRKRHKAADYQSARMAPTP